MVLQCIGLLEIAFQYISSFAGSYNLSQLILTINVVLKEKGVQMEFLTFKQYAESQGITYEAVRRQVARYANDLADHIVIKNRTQYLDEVAVEFLTRRRRESPIILTTIDQAEDIKKLTEEVDALKNKLMTAQGELLKEKERTIELQYELKKSIEAKTLYDAMLEDNKQKTEQVQAMQKEIEDLRRERDAAQAEAQSFTRSILGFYRKK